VVNRCPQCGYELRGSPGPSCPECGWSGQRVRSPSGFRIVVALIVGVCLFLFAPAITVSSTALERFLLPSIPIAMWLAFRSGRLTIPAWIALAAGWIYIAFWVG